MLNPAKFTLLSLLPTTLAFSTCKLPIPSSSYISEVPTWLSENYTCTGAPQVFEVRPSPGKGMGFFATRTLEPGDVILWEAPTMRVHPPQFKDGVAYPLADVETLIINAYEALSHGQKMAVRDLSRSTFTASVETPLHELVPLFRNNAYIIGESLGLFVTGARINHSCRPNSSQVWIERLGKRVVYAIRRIEAGEEIYATYIPLLHSHELRQKRLTQYGFKCSCEACAQEQAAQQASDQRRIDIRNAFAAFEPQLTLSIPKTAEGRRKAEKNAKASIELAELVEEEELVDYYAQAYRIAAISHARIEKWEPATLWAHKSYQLRMMADEQSQATAEIKALTNHLISNWNDDLRNKSMRQG